jgi:hypothetical protein
VVLLVLFAAASDGSAYALAHERGPEATTVLLGNRMVRDHRNDLHAERAEAFRMRARTSGVTGVVRIYVDRGSTARAVVVGIYSNAAGRPGVLLSEGSRSALRVHAWSAVSITPATLESGRTYWLALLGEGGTLRYRSRGRRHGPCLSSRSARAHLRELPKRWSTGRVRARIHCPISAYVATDLAPTLHPPTPGLPSLPLEPSLPVPSTPSPGVRVASPESPVPIPGSPTPAPKEPSSPGEPPPHEESPKPQAPKNTVAPVISGSAVEGEKLSTGTGTWSGSPTSYSYQWRDCDGSGEDCSNIAGATGSTRVLASSDVNYTLQVVVRATNAHGTGEATSKATPVVTAKQKTGAPENCFPNPEGCGYPGVNNTGVANCSELKPSGSKTITKSETIENTDITGSVTVDASGVRLNHDCVVYDGGESEGSAAVVLESGASDFTVSNTTVRGENTTSGSFEEAIRNNHSDPGAVASKDRFEDCGECIHQSWTLDESYVIANGRERADENGSAHAEDWWFSNGTIGANDDTLLSPSKQTAVIFAESGGGACENHETVTDSLLAGGGSVFYFCAHSTGAGSSSIEIKNDRFARQACAKKEIEDYEGRGGFGCQPEGGYFEDGEGSGGYFPRGGFFGLVYEGEGIYNRGVGWEGNFWDNNLESQAEAAY